MKTLRNVGSALVWMGLTAALAAAGCTGNSDVEEPLGPGGTGGNSAVGSVGDACVDRTACRLNLDCVEGRCEFGASQVEGERCSASGECLPGLQCVVGSGASGSCQASVGRGDGEPCASDLDCATGLRCAIVGLGAQCTAQGTGDIGQDCASSGDCYAGLMCVQGADGGSCVPGQSGVPTFGLPTFSGVHCDPPSTAGVRAYFEVPGASGGEPGDFFRLPFPNDVRRTSGRIDLEGFPTPGPSFLGYDPLQRYIDVIEAQAEGFSANASVLFRFSAQVDFESFRQDGAVNWVDVTPGAPELGAGAGLAWYYTTGRSNYVCDNWLGIRRPLGEPLLPGHTYAAWLTTQGRGSGGSVIERSPHLVALLDPAAPADSALTAAHGAYAPFRDYLAAESIDRNTILNATVFTVAPLKDPMAELAAAVAAAPAPTTSRWVRCTAGGNSPCPEAQGDRACGADSADYDEYHALVSLPVFQRGQAPYLNVPDGALDTSAPVRTEEVCLALSVPKGATMPAAGWPLALYAHGTGGSFRSHLTPTVAGALARATATAGALPMAVLGIDQVQHGPRRGGSTRTPSELFFNFGNPEAARSNPLQGAADQLSLLRLVSSLDLDAATTGGDAIRIDATQVVFWGHSQGGTHGSLALPYMVGVRGAVLSGNGGSLVHSLLEKTAPVNIAAALPLVLGDASGAGLELTGGVHHPGLGLLQLWVDPADPVHFARAIARQPDTGRSPIHLFLPYGQDDSFSPPTTMAAFVLAARAGQAQADPSVTTPDEIKPGFGAGPTPFSGNVTVDGNPVTIAMRQYAPPSGSDGHFVVFDVPSANADAVRFLAQAAAGEVPAVGR